MIRKENDPLLIFSPLRQTHAQLGLLVALSAAAQSLTGLVALQAIPNDALAKGELPARLKLFNWGDNDTVSKGKFKVGKTTMASLSRNQDALGFDRIALDFNHNSLPGHPNYQADPRDVAAYGKPLCIEGDGLYLDEITYTPAGRKHAASYSDLSPTPRLNDAGEVDFLHSVALCPQGEVKGLTFLSADFLSKQPPSPKIMTLDPKKLCIALGIAENSDETAIMAAIAFRKEGATGGLNVSALSAEIKEILKPFGDTVTALQARFDRGDRDRLVALAVREGKVIPKSAIEGTHALNNAQLEALIGDLEVTVPVERRTPAGVTALAAGSGDDGLDAAQREVNATLGITDDAFKKHNAKK